mmetsp:Transcript_139267/g.277692  ORF Transcript_139267/g.277692 Transcript_139267/m.277692 type:complete len:96 (+) Transcript_139267:1217-1504(+)
MGACAIPAPTPKPVMARPATSTVYEVAAAHSKVPHAAITDAAPSIVFLPKKSPSRPEIGHAITEKSVKIATNHPISDSETWKNDLMESKAAPMTP